MSELWQGPLEKIDGFRWRIPQSYKPGMRVPGLIFADEKLLKDIKHDKALEQVANVAFLPGIVDASLAMPDIHWGFGFCIGGVAATDVDADGVISPGGVGFDINCLTADTRILHAFGYTRSIKEFEFCWPTQRLVAMNFSQTAVDETQVQAYMKVKPKEKIYEIETSTGTRIKATADHPFWTQDGMVPLKRLKPGVRVALYPFSGVPHEDPSDGVIVNEDDVRSFLKQIKPNVSEYAVSALIKELSKRNLLPLRFNSPALPYLIKLLGYCTGDGNIHFDKKSGKGVVGFWGKKEDLESIRLDVAKTGFTCSRVYQRNRKHSIPIVYDTVKFETLESSCKVVGSAFAALLAILGCPCGNKTEQAYSVPAWLFKATLWQKRLFLASYFGAEMFSPKCYAENNYNFYCPVVSMNKNGMLADNGIAFFKDISRLLAEFGVRTVKISEAPSNFTKAGAFNYRLRLILSTDGEDLINLYSKVGFEYNKGRQYLANVAVQFLKYKQHVLSKRQAAVEQTHALYQEGLRPTEIFEKLGSEFVNKRFIERTLYGGRKTSPRISFAAENFALFLDEHANGLGCSGMVWDTVSSLTEMPAEDVVYDFTVKHPDHNFVANNFVVSNCGVRLVKTNLRFDDVKDKIKDLTRRLFSDIPTGVGSEGDIRVNAKEEKQILLKGSRWAVEQGYGTESDLECTEENGSIEGADPDAVSDRAYERGRSQSGTLGSGNHFLEIQVIDQLYDSRLCDEFGFDLGQITVMIHSGSRGFGYQVCDDYVKTMLRCLEKYHINVPDRQLACAPVNSPEGKAYLGAMKCAANYGWANRQCLMHLTRKVFEKFFGSSWEKLGMHLVYDVAHNIAKIETHTVNGEKKKLCVHRKGATRAFGPGSPGVPQRYQKTGQPVIIPGDMGRNSYMLVGTQGAMDETFGSTCHGAGRLKSRTAALRTIDAGRLLKSLESKGITVLATGRGTIVEEASEAYKDVNNVVDVVHNAGISKRVCRMRPLGVIKG